MKSYVRITRKRWIFTVKVLLEEYKTAVGANNRWKRLNYDISHPRFGGKILMHTDDCIILGYRLGLTVKYEKYYEKD